MTPLTLIELRCPACGDTVWVMDHVVRGLVLAGRPEHPFPARSYICRHCRYRGKGFAFLQKAPAGFLLQPHPQYPMGRKAFRYWIEILRQNFPDYFRLRDGYDGFYPNLPTLRQQLAGALTVMSFLLENRLDRRRYGNQAYKMDRICLTILFEHHLKRLYHLPPGDANKRLLEHVGGSDVDILDDFTLRRLILVVFGRAREIVRRRLTFEHWQDDAYFAIGLDSYHRFGHQSVHPPMPDPGDWNYTDSHDLPSEERLHTRLWWPVEDIL